MSDRILLCEDNDALHKWLMDRQVGKFQMGGGIANTRTAFGKVCASLISDEFLRLKLENHGMWRYAASITGKFDLISEDNHSLLACAICFDKPMTACVLPCKHAYLCDECAEFTQTHETMSRCAICRKDIQEVVKAEKVEKIFKCGVQTPDEAHILFEEKGKKYRDNVLVVKTDILKECLDILAESDVANTASELAIGQPAAFWALAAIAKTKGQDVDDMYAEIREITGGRRKRRRR